MNKLKEVLLAGAIGDAFGYLIEFDDVKAIKQKYGNEGLKFNKYFDGIACSDDTQMTLFLLEAIKKWNEPYTDEKFKELSHKAFYDWYKTQVGFDKAPDDFTLLSNRRHIRKQENKTSLRSLLNSKKKPEINESLIREDFTLLSYSEMWHQCAPGFTCLKALGSGEVGDLIAPINDSMGCGMVMRVASVLALREKNPSLTDLDILNAAYIQAATTHGNAEGLIATGVYTLLLQYLMQGVSPLLAFEKALNFVYHPDNDKYGILSRVPSSLKDYFNKIIDLINEPTILNEVQIEEVCGGGWIAPSCVGLAFYAFCKANSFEHCLELSVNHQGDSDSTGTLAAQLYVAYNNVDVLKYKKTNLTDVILKLFSV